MQQLWDRAGLHPVNLQRSPEQTSSHATHTLARPHLPHDRLPLDERTPDWPAQLQLFLSSLLPTACLQLSAGALRQGSPRPHALAARTTTSPAQPPSTNTWTGQSLLRTTLRRWHTCTLQPPSHGLHLQLAAC